MLTREEVDDCYSEMMIPLEWKERVRRRRWSWGNRRRRGIAKIGVKEWWHRWTLPPRTAHPPKPRNHILPNDGLVSKGSFLVPVLTLSKYGTASCLAALPPLDSLLVVAHDKSFAQCLLAILSRATSFA